MKSIFKFIYKLLLIVVLVGLITGAIDYFQLKSNNFPLFAQRNYEAPKKKETFRGLFYKATRIVSISPSESLPLSKNVKFYLLIFDIPLKIDAVPINKDFTIKTKEDETSTTSKLYYYNGATKIYAYGLKEINVKDKGQTKSLDKALDKDISVIDKMTNYLFVSKVMPSFTQYVDMEETNFSDNGLSIIRCQKQDNTDIYIGPRTMEFQEDFCTTKDDIPKEQSPDEMQEQTNQTVEGQDLSPTE